MIPTFFTDFRWGENVLASVFVVDNTFGGRVANTGVNTA